MLKKIKADAPKQSLKKETMPVKTVSTKFIRSKDNGQTYIGVITKVDDENYTVVTDLGEIRVPKNEVSSVVGVVSEFNSATDKLKEAEAIVNSLKPIVNRLGFEEIVTHNSAKPLEPWTSLKIEDSRESADAPVHRARVSSTERYPFANGDAVSQVFDSLLDTAIRAGGDREALQKKYDVNAYVQETTVAAFDAKFFLDEKGNFDQKRYDAVMAAMDVVAKKFNVASPLSAKTVVLPKPGFHDKRWSTFTAEENMKISQVLPNVVSVSANQK